MGKSRGGAAKAGSVFRIARSGVLKAKAKGKARPVTSGLKQAYATGGIGLCLRVPSGKSLTVSRLVLGNAMLKGASAVQRVRLHRTAFTASLRINIKNAEKVSTINKAFAEVQKEIRQLSKGTTAEPQNTQQVSTNLEEEPANVDAATNLLSQL
ncbi:hypothetical protein EK904_011770 [Melospiza melodia maxima]|nr:hypothetical protein EK904_011770 [Melospiza melodia maxima]